jgi:tetratricopeptide (TPR) repeat protein
MKRLLKAFLLILIPIISFGQDFQIEFQKYCETNDTISQKETLKKWEEVKPNDPELFTSYFNYHFMRARQEVIALTNEEPNGEGFELRDSSNQVAGFLGSQIYFDPIEIQKGIDKIDEGIKNFPNRLDMRFGKIYVLGQIEDWERFAKEIISTVDYSATNQNKWTWTNNEKQEGGIDFFLSSIQDYQVQLYNTGNDSLLLNMRQIANAILTHYPEHIESLSNLSITYLLLGEYDKGIEPLLKAEKINSEDYIVLSNIAQGYKLKGDKNKAIEYYKKTIKFGDEQAIKYAKQQIEELEK